MIRLLVSDPGQTDADRRPRRRFGLDTPLPADPAVVERAILRHLATSHPSTVVLALDRPESSPAATPDQVSLSAGAPDLMLLLPGGRVAFLVVKTQARRLSAAERAFGDLCRALAVPVEVVRSLPEARTALGRLRLTEENDR